MSIACSKFLNNTIVLWNNCCTIYQSIKSFAWLFIHITPLLIFLLWLCYHMRFVTLKISRCVGYLIQYLPLHLIEVTIHLNIFLIVANFSAYTNLLADFHISPHVNRLNHSARKSVYRVILVILLLFFCCM